MAESLKGVAAPKPPPGAPAHVEHLLSRLAESLELDAAGSAFRAMRELLTYLLEYFAGVSAAMAVERGKLEDKPKALWRSQATVHDLETLIGKALTGLAEFRTDPAVASLRAVFFVGETGDKPSPRRHSRLLRFAGSPFRGYVYLSDLCKLAPSGRDAYTAEVKRYIPLLKDWLMAAAPFFQSCKVLEEGVTPEGLQEAAVELDGKRLELGPAIRVKDCSLCATVAAAPRKAARPAGKVPAKPGSYKVVRKADGTLVKVPVNAAATPAPAASPVKGGVVKKVLVVKRPDGTIVRKVVTTVAASAGKARVAEAEPPALDGPPATPAGLLAPQPE
ncbi:MAG: hypothetical protein AB1758_25825, partial [Candidatus Eremiobacterota bacterium]